VANRYSKPAKIHWGIKYLYSTRGGIMKVDNIRIGSPVSENLHLYEEEIRPSDLLKILRFISKQGRTLGSIYEKNQLFYTDSERITRQEFGIIYEKQARDLKFWLDNFTREDFVNKLSSVMKIVSSTTKDEIINRIVRDKEIIFNHFKKEFVEKYSGKWSGFKSHKVLLPAASDETKKLIFNLGSKQKPLSGKNYQQYWHLGEGYDSTELTRDLRTEIIGDAVTINLKDNDEIILRKMNRFPEKNKNSASLNISPIHLDIKDNDLHIGDCMEIEYGQGINNLAGYFNVRKNSKFKTFCEGLRTRAEAKTVKKYLERKFLLATQLDDIYCGIDHDKELFEKLCWHLKIEYMREDRIICRVVETETSEALAALWEIINGDKRQYKFSFVEL
jgi:hypothetical protein